METNKIFIIVITFSVFMSCASYKQDISGIYLQNENKRIELHLSKNKSFLLKDNFEPTHLAIKNYKCCDTISYGNWIRGDKFLSLSSLEELGTFYLNANVKETFDRTKDSVRIVINNPIEKENKDNKQLESELYYSIYLSTSDGKSISKKTSSNVINLVKADDINMIEIEISPKHNIPIRSIEAREVYTIPYEVKNPNANIFEIDIPKLDYGYLAYKRLVKDYVKIVNENKLLWDGKEYIKQ